MKRFFTSLIAAIAFPATIHAQTAYVSVSVWSVPAEPAVLIQNPDLVAQFQSVVEAGADRIYSARLSENGVANITFYPLTDALDGVLEQTAALRSGAASAPGFELLTVLEGTALTQIDATPTSTNLGSVSTHSGPIFLTNGNCLMVAGGALDDSCPNAPEKNEFISISVWNVPADPALLAQDPALAGQLQSFVDIGADRLFPVRLSESSVAFLTFYTDDDELEGVLQASRAARTATASGTPGFELVEVYEAPVLFTAH